MSALTDEPCDLRFIDVTKSYPDFCLSGVSLGVPRGCVMGLVGANGAGKTTLMRLALGTVSPDSGTVELSSRAKTGFVGAVCPYPAQMSVPEVARMHEIAQEDFDRTAFERTCEALALPTDSTRRIADLSRGMGMKLQLACAVASGATLLLMDEPTAGLDPMVRGDVLDLLRRWMEPGDRSILISSHITSDLERICDYVTVIDDGRVLLTCERDLVDGVMGVARLREEELGRVLEDGLAGAVDADDALARPRVLRDGMSWALLVPDRAAFMRAYPGLVCDRASIEDVTTLLVRGEER